MNALLCILAVTAQILFARGDQGYDTFRIPALIRASNGDLLAFAEARKDSRRDSGNIDLVMRRSTDGGRNWGPICVVWDDGPNTCGNPAPVVDAADGRLVLLATWNDGRDRESDIRARKSFDSRRVYVLYSEDNGTSWSQPREITAEVKKAGWTWYATGPCHAIQLRRGPHRGRLVVPCDHGRENLGYGSHVILSDDGGLNWRIGGCLDDGNESTACELRGGRILLNMRTNRARGTHVQPWRLTAFSEDGGEHFSPAAKDPELTEPVCQGSILSAPDGRTLWFCNPAHPQIRENLTLRRSRNGGRSWKEALVLAAGPSAYSDLCLLPDGSVAVLYECGEHSPYETISFSVVVREDYPKR